MHYSDEMFLEMMEDAPEDRTIMISEEGALELELWRKENL